MSKKDELIKAIYEEFSKIAKIDEDSGKIFEQTKEQLRLHTADPIVYSPTSGDANAARSLGRRYAERYEAIAVLFDELDVEQGKAYAAWKGNK